MKEHDSVYFSFCFQSETENDIINLLKLSGFIYLYTFILSIQLTIDVNCELYIQCIFR